MPSRSQDYVGCTLGFFGMGVAFLAAEPWNFYNIVQFLVFDYSPNQPLTGLGFAIAALGGIILARTDDGEKSQRAVHVALTAGMLFIEQNDEGPGVSLQHHRDEL
jgi:hypothetical protein